ncbi:hypothetical protein DITRI_Ditri09bG0062800 [Diplodiscus trichospermus]
MGRHPGDLNSSLSSPSSSSSLPNWKQMLLKDVMDQRLSSRPSCKQCGLWCKAGTFMLRSQSTVRPTMRQVSQAITGHCLPLSKPFSMITLGKLFDD